VTGEEVLSIKKGGDHLMQKEDRKAHRLFDYSEITFSRLI